MPNVTRTATAVTPELVAQVPLLLPGQGKGEGGVAPALVVLLNAATETARILCATQFRVVNGFLQVLQETMEIVCLRLLPLGTTPHAGMLQRVVATATVTSGLETGRATGATRAAPSVTVTVQKKVARRLSRK